MRSLLRRLACLLALAALAACASAGGASPEAPRQRRDSNRLLQEEIMATRVGDAYEAVRQLRPNWLRTRGATSLRADGSIRVYVDNVPVGGPEALRSVPINSISSIQFLDSRSATQRWGTDHVDGAILVLTM